MGHQCSLTTIVFKHAADIDGFVFGEMHFAEELGEVGGVFVDGIDGTALFHFEAKVTEKIEIVIERAL